LGLEPFLRYYRGLRLSPTDTSSNIDFSTRVAIIDTGVDISNPLLRARIQNGISYVQYGYECRESPWWLASDPHGTQMVSLIQNIDPNSKLFIAKVGIDRKHVIEPEKILKVRSPLSSQYSNSCS
jgi:Subtilase family